MLVPFLILNLIYKHQLLLAIILPLTRLIYILYLLFRLLCLLLFLLLLLCLLLRILDYIPTTASDRPRDCSVVVVLRAILRRLLVPLRKLFLLVLVLLVREDNLVRWHTAAGLPHGLIKRAWLSHELLYGLHLSWAYIRCAGRCTRVWALSYELATWATRWFSCPGMALQASLRLSGAWLLLFSCFNILQGSRLLQDSILDRQFTVVANRDYLVCAFAFLFYGRLIWLHLFYFLLFWGYWRFFWRNYLNFCLLLFAQFF